MSKLFLLLGGNLGNKNQVFSQARKMLATKVGRIIAQSSIYETEPWGFDSEDLFWNQVVLVETILSPQQALEAALRIEKELGRTRKSAQYSSRIIDLDLLFYDDLVLQTPQLQLPHPRMAERRFVLEPLAEIAPDKFHPETLETVAQMLGDCPDELKVSKLTK